MKDGGDDSVEPIISKIPLIKEGPHSKVPERVMVPDEPDTVFTNYGNKTTLPIERVLEREEDMRKIRNSNAAGSQFLGLLWSNIVTFPQA